MLQTDDTLRISNDTLLKKERNESQRFESNTIHVANKNMPLVFNGSQVTVLPGLIKVVAAAQAVHLAVISTSIVMKDEYVAQQAQRCSIALIRPPQCAFAFSQAAQYPNPTKKCGYSEPCNYFL